MSKPKAKRNGIELGDKLKIVQKLESGKKQIDIVKEHGLSASTVSRIFKEREKIKKLSGSSNLNFKKIRQSDYPTVDSAALEWFRFARSMNFPVTQQILMDQAKQIAIEQGIEGFKASDGWLAGFKKRYRILLKAECGSEAAVNMTEVNNWLTNVWADLKAAYDPKDIYNTDETGLFYRLMPQKTLEYKGKSCHGGKQSKERVTVLLCCNADGTDKMKPLVIGKYQKPRCLAKLDLSTLPVTYRANKTAWMTAKIFEEWTRSIDIRMIREKRKILLVMDNVPSHVAADYSQLQNVKVVFLPPNATSKVQPLDRGIIHSYKSKYRHQLMRRLVATIGEQSHLKIDVLDAIHGTAQAWNLVTPECISNCFRSAGLIPQLPEPEIETVVEENEIPSAALQQLNLTNFDFNEYVNVDSEVLTCEEPSIRQIALDHIQSPPTAPDGDDSDADDAEDVEREVVTSSAALKCLDNLKYYFTCSGHDKELSMLHDLERSITQKSIVGLKQTSIHDFFKN